METYGAFPRKVTEVKAKHPKKASSPIEFSVAGRVNDSRDAQSLNAFAPIAVTRLGMMSRLRLTHPLNAAGRMEVESSRSVRFRKIAAGAPRGSPTSPETFRVAIGQPRNAAFSTIAERLRMLRLFIFEHIPKA